MASERDIKLFKGGNYSDLVDYMDRVEVVPSPFVNGVNFTLGTDSSFKHILSSNVQGLVPLVTPAIAVIGEAEGGRTTLEPPQRVESFNDTGSIAGLIVAQEIDYTQVSSDWENTWKGYYALDGRHAPLTLCMLRIAGSNDIFRVSTVGDFYYGRVVYGVLVCPQGVTTSTAIAGGPLPAAANLRMDFGIFDAGDIFEPYTLPAGSYEFTVNQMYRERSKPQLFRTPAPVEADIPNNLDVPLLINRYLVDPGDFVPAGTPINLNSSTSGGGWSITYLPLNHSQPLNLPSGYGADGNYTVMLNGVPIFQGVGVQRINDTSIELLTHNLYPGEEIEIVFPYEA